MIAFEDVAFTFVMPLFLAVVADNISALIGGGNRLFAFVFGLNIAKFHWNSLRLRLCRGWKTFGIAINIVNNVGSSFSKCDCLK